MTYDVPEPPVRTRFRLESPRGIMLATRTWWMPENERATTSDSDGTTTTTTTTPRALLLIVHGGGWHSGYFGALAEHLTSLGIFVAAYDQAGAGYSEAEPGAPPDCIHFWEFDDLIDDVFAAVEWARLEVTAEFPDSPSELPLFLLGESFGGPQVIKAGMDAPRRNVDFKGIISLGGVLKIGDDLMPPRVVVSILRWLAQYYPKTVMPMDTASTFDDAFGDKEWARTARRDPKIKVHCPGTLAAMSSFLSCGDELLEHAGEFPFPFLAIHGKHDVRTKCDAMQEFVDKVGPDAKMIALTNTLGHQLLQDVPEVVNQVISDVGNWIEEQLDSKGAKH